MRASGRARLAERVTTLKTFVVVENMGVDLLSDSGTGSTACRSSEKCSHERTGQTTEDRPYGTSDQT